MTIPQKPFREFLAVLWLAHHPHCDTFRYDTFKLGKWRICIGCSMAFSAFAFMLLIGFQTGLFAMLTGRTLFICSIGFSAGYLLSKFGLKRFVFFRFFSKISVGIGGAFVMGVIDRFSFSPLIRIIIGIMIFEIALFIHSLLRGISIYRTCQRCESQMDWDTCPGMN